jgi:thiamine biosynthesis lipoprotein
MIESQRSITPDLRMRIMAAGVMVDPATSVTPAAPSRRRFLCIAAGLAGGLVPGMALSSPVPSAGIIRWRGAALGAVAQIQLSHSDRDLAARVLRLCRDEIQRLEALFSLYDPDSAVSRLNRSGALADPGFELVELFSLARSICNQTDGAFDVTVQPLWRIYADHFAAPDADPEGPSRSAIGAILPRIGGQWIEVSPRRIGFAKDGMAVTLNGIAQGYITDRVAGLLRRNGFDNVLVHLGESMALGSRPDGTPWLAGIAAADGSGRLVGRTPLCNNALATSGGYGTVFSADGRHHHLFDPRTGRSTSCYRSVSVLHPSAAVADGLSTAFSALPEQRIARIIGAYRGARAILIGDAGKPVVIG